MKVNRGYLSEWERLFSTNRQLKLEVLRLLDEYGVRTSGNNEEKQDSYIARQDAWTKDQHRSFRESLKQITRCHGLPEWIAEQVVTAVLLGGYSLPGTGVSIVTQKSPHSSRSWIRIEPHADLEDPFNRRMIEHFQRKLLFEQDPPPSPQPSADRSRQLDWTIVWEWKQKHPQITHRDLAHEIGYSAQYVRKKLAQVDREKSQQDWTVL